MEATKATEKKENRRSAKKMIFIQPKLVWPKSPSGLSMKLTEAKEGSLVNRLIYWFDLIEMIRFD